jgi:hypothetical protein
MLFYQSVGVNIRIGSAKIGVQTFERLRPDSPSLKRIFVVAFFAARSCHDPDCSRPALALDLPPTVTEGSRAALRPQLEIWTRSSRENIHNSAEGISTVQGRTSATDDLNCLNITEGKETQVNKTILEAVLANPVHHDKEMLRGRSAKENCFQRAAPAEILQEYGIRESEKITDISSLDRRTLINLDNIDW